MALFMHGWHVSSCTAVFPSLRQTNDNNGVFVQTVADDQRVPMEVKHAALNVIATLAIQAKEAAAKYLMGVVCSRDYPWETR